MCASAINHRLLKGSGSCKSPRAPSSYTTSFPWARVVECETWGERGIGGSVAILAGDDRMGSEFPDQGSDRSKDGMGTCRV
jgi:hypothetical protein